MANSAKRQVRPPEWALRLTLWVYAVVSIPLYMWFLHHSAVRWAGHLDKGDSLRFWLPIVVPGAAFTFTLLAAISWWYSAFTGTEYLAGRRRWWFLIVFIAALSLAAGVIAAQVRDVNTVILTAMVTTIGMLGLWLLPPTLSPRLLEALPKRGQRPSAG
ncbi:hypothetical protein [Streptomyces atratus]|uniref:hypothetical protein n=1 Tax=Streptomyces atratus TaxID=1893 RepID=UPI00224EA943|nr:hypothetical protein [Streptomyces atratus]MCX5346126.1 hypothetical protein [Streptomyces atratus]